MGETPGAPSGTDWNAQPRETTGHQQSGADHVIDTATQKADELAGKASHTIDEGMDRAASGLDSAADMLRERGKQMDGSGSVQSSTAMVANKLDAASTYLRDKDSGQVIADLEELVRQKPAQSLLVAAGIGFVISKILR